MSYRGIKRVLGESSLERKIRVMFGICLLALIAGSFLWVNRITEDLIHQNIRRQADGFKSDFILRTHLKNLKVLKDPASEELFKALATEPLTTPYAANTVVLDDRVVRQQIGALENGTWQPTVATDPGEITRLSRLAVRTIEVQSQQNELDAFREPDPKAYLEKLKTIEESLPIDDGDVKFEELAEVDNSSGQKYVYYTPIIFRSKSSCICLLYTSPSPRDRG